MLRVELFWSRVKVGPNVKVAVEGPSKITK
jgi:hypothetical protein